MVEAVIGLECHVQLDTQSKMFCACPLVDEGPPNRAVCPVCLGYPGTLPTVNARAVVLGVRAAVALGSTVHRHSAFDRKHYVYPDLAKGYQITQQRLPLATGGTLRALVEGAPIDVSIARIHLEEDAGRSLRRGEAVWVDFNRAGAPLIEVVFAPTLTRPAEAEAVFRALHRVLVEAGVTRGSLVRGHMRCDANVSVSRSGAPWGTRVEVKNLNSFRFVARALAFEIDRQTAVIRGGGEVVAETRAWRDGRTISLRRKEGAADYRFLPEPDLGPLVVEDAFVEEQRSSLPGVPLDRWLLDRAAETRCALATRYGLAPGAVDVLAARPSLERFFVAAVEAGGAASAMAAWLQGAVLRRENLGEALEDSGLTPAALVVIQRGLDEGRLTRPQAREVFDAVWAGTEEVSRLIVAVQRRAVPTESGLRSIVDEVIAAGGEQVARYRSGNSRVLGYFIGEVLRSTGGTADPALVRRLVVEALHRI